MHTRARRYSGAKTHVVGSVWAALIHAFAHLVDDLVSGVGSTLGVVYGVPPAAVPALARMAMRVEAGDPKAHAAARRLMADGGMVGGVMLPPSVLRPALGQMRAKLREHPHFGHFQAAASAERKKRVSGHFVSA